MVKEIIIGTIWKLKVDAGIAYFQWYNSATDKWEDKLKLKLDTNEIQLIGDFADDFTMKDDKIIYFGTDNDFSLKYDSANDRWVIAHRTAGELLQLKSDGFDLVPTLKDDVKLYFGTDKDYSGRFDPTNNDFRIKDEANATEFIFPRNVNRHFGNIGPNFDSGDQGVTVGGAGSPGSVTLVSLDTGQLMLLPLAIYMAAAAATGETVTVTVKAVLDDGSEYTLEDFAVTATSGSETVAPDWAAVLNAIKAAAASLDGRRITSIKAYAESSLATPSATASATARVIGIGI